jgi:hypothetical protein
MSKVTLQPFRIHIHPRMEALFDDIDVSLDEPDLLLIIGRGDAVLGNDERHLETAAS